MSHVVVQNAEVEGTDSSHAIILAHVEADPETVTFQDVRMFLQVFGRQAVSGTLCRRVFKTSRLAVVTRTDMPQA